MKRAGKAASNAMVYHQAYLERSAEDNNWDLGPITKKINRNLGQDSSEEESDNDYPKTSKVSRERFNQLMEGTRYDVLMLFIISAI